ncbi:MAG TPA: DUF1573 domain-containing protein [Chitinophagaceae bacterium]|nr:DUF1573 domain-containing protein [Chitinophagaceae bacterium]
MKRFLTLFSLLIGFICVGAQNNNTNPKTDPLKLKENEFDFTKIPQGKPVYHIFEVVNTGKDSLKLDDVKASCGCTTPEWSPEPIAPGSTAEIKVGYNAASEGYFEKFITITYNSNQTKQIKIKGTVWKAPEGSAPTNASIQFLKKQTL